MTLFQRAHDILAAKADKALDAAEKPDEMLDLSYDQMLDHLTQVRQALVTVAASRKQIELQEQQLQHSADHLQDQAKAALAAGREDLAREALGRLTAHERFVLLLRFEGGLSHAEMFNARRIVKARAARGDAAASDSDARKARHATFGLIGTLAVVVVLALVAYGTG